jgi:hypothetical protein
MLADGTFLMTDKSEQFDQDNSSEFSDEAVRRFLLGGLSASERPLFEQRLFTNDDLEARVRLAELDLADDYAFEHLSTPDRRLFGQRFLVTAGRQQKLQVSRNLRDRFSAKPAGSSEKSKVAKRLKHLFGLDRPAWRFAFGILILLILFGTAWLVIREPRIARQIANRIMPRRSPPQSAPLKAGHPTNTSMPEHQITPSPMPAHDQATVSPAGVSIALTPAVSSQTSEVPALNLPKGEQDVVRLQLVLKADQTGPYRAELVTSEGSSVFSAEALKPNDSRAKIDFDVPARLLKTGDYQIRLGRSNEGSRESLGSYYFRVQ